MFTLSGVKLYFFGGPHSGPCLWAGLPAQGLAEVYLNGLFARFVRNHDLFWHIASFLCFIFVLSIPLDS